MPIYTKEEQFELIKENCENLRLIDNQYEDVCLEAVKKSVPALRHVKEQTLKICMAALDKSWSAFGYIRDLTPEICLAAVRENGILLLYIKEQTHELCLEAVKSNGLALDYVKEQTPEICLEAVKQDGNALDYVKNKTPELCFYAFINDYDVDRVKKYIKDNHIKNKVFCDKNIKKLKNADFYFDYRSLKVLKEYLLKENSNNKYIFDDNADIDILKEISLSNNELVIIDTGEIKDIHKMLANKIIKKEYSYKKLN